MARVQFTQALQRHVACPPVEVDGRTAAEALANAFADNPRARGYVLTDQGGLHKHVSVFVDGAAVADRQRLSDPVAKDSEIIVLQALSGG